MLQKKGVEAITLVVPYLPYCRGEPGQLISILNLLKQFGVGACITMDLHNGKAITGCQLKIIQISAVATLAKEVKKILQDDVVVVAPDLGGAELAASYAEKLRYSFAVIEKKRENAHTVCALSLLGSVRGKNVLLADDICSTTATLSSAAMFCREKGAKKIYAVVTHGLFVGQSLDVLKKSGIETLYVTDTVSIDLKIAAQHRIVVVSVAKDFAKALSQ